MIWLYDGLWLAALVGGAPLWLPWVWVSARRRRGLLERFRPLPVRAEPTVWLHLASVGEAEAAHPLLDSLCRCELPLILTTQTPTGRDRLREFFPQLTVRLAPLDLPGLIGWSVRRARVRTLVLVETELWPNFIRATHAAGGRIVWVSARISDRTYQWYRRARPLLAPLLASVDALGARSEADRARFAALGVREDRTTLMGDLKLDRAPPGPPSAELARALGPGPFLIGGSTHADEERALLRVWQRLRADVAPDLRLLLVPRHPDRVPALRAELAREGARIGLRSQGAAEAEVVLVDSIGELASLYGLAELVFCGGTLVPVGGHNLLEPVRAGRVVVHGPHTENQRPQVRLLQPFGVLHRVGDVRELERVLRELWQDPRRHAPAEAARQGLAAHRGAAERALALVLGDEVADAPLSVG